MKVIVTGSAGFIGGVVEQYLQDNSISVIGMDTRQSATYDNDVTTHRRLFESVEWIIHCAAWTSVTKSVKYPMEDATQNILGTINMLKQYPEAKFIYLSTAGIYGEGKHHTEQTPMRPQSPYAISKMAGEYYVRTLSRHWVILRLANVIDPTGKRKKGEPNVYQIFSEQKKLTIYGDGTQTRDFISVDEIAKVIHKVIQKGIRNQVFNIGSGRRKTVLEVAKEFNKPYNFADAREGEIHEFGLNVEKARNAGIL